LWFYFYFIKNVTGLKNVSFW